METNNLEIETYKSIIFRLDREQRKEKNWNKRTKINLKLKENLEKALKIAPNDIELQIDLMYVYIHLKELEKAKEIANALLGQTETKGFLNGLAIIEEKSGNYDKAIEYLKRILELEPNNQALKDRIEIMEHKKENIPIDAEILEKKKAYRKIASLERSIEKEAEEKQSFFERKGKHTDRDKILQKQYLRTYQQVRKIAEHIIEKHPEEIVAREKRIKALYITGQQEEAKQEIENVLDMYDKDEMALWYLAKIQRSNGALQQEKETLEKILDNSEPGTNIRVQQRLEKVNQQIEEQQKREEVKKEEKIGYTEEARKKFLEELQKDFIYGNISQKEIPAKIKEARKYPNFDKSLVELLDIQSMMTGNKEQKIKGLENYIDKESSITAEEYGRILEAITSTREDIERDKKIEAYIDAKEQTEKDKKQKQLKEQREYSKEIIQRLKNGKITEEELPEIVASLEKFADRARAVFLITKLYEVLYDKETAYNQLIKYSKISDLSPEEKQRIAEMQKTLTDEQKKTRTIKKIKRIYQRKQEKQQRYNKKKQTENVKQLLEEGRTVKQIFNLLKDRGISLKTIIAIKGRYIKGNEAFEKKNATLEEDAQALLKGGYTPDEVYELIEYDIPISKLKNMARELKRGEIEI